MASPQSTRPRFACRTHFDYRALEHASERGEQAVVELLLRHSDNVKHAPWLHHRSFRYCRSLYLASKGGHRTVVELLLQNGACVNGHDIYSGYYQRDSFNALYAASEGGHREVVELLLQNGADVNAVIRPTRCWNKYSNALYAASEGGHREVVELLLQNGADVNAGVPASNFWGQSNALNAASRKGNWAVVELLLQNGADVNAKVFLNYHDYETVLYAASREGHWKVVQLLLQNGAEVNVKGYVRCGGYDNALCAASREGHWAVVQLLLENGADSNSKVSVGFHHDENALFAASRGGHQAVVKLLLQHGADVNARVGPFHIRNALYIASLEGHREVMLLLLQNGAEIIVTDLLVTPFGMLSHCPSTEIWAKAARLKKEMEISSAALEDDWNTVRRLVAEGCDPNFGQSFMERPLSIAIMHANLKEAEYLLRNYAIRDLGDQFYPLRDAILRGDVQEAQAVLTRPRSLKPPKVETRKQTLQRHFHETYNIFKTGSQSRGASHKFSKLAIEMDSHRRMWRIGMTGVRRLTKNRSPQNVQQVIGVLCVASAMRKTMQSEDTFGNYDLFLEDLDRWRELAVLPQQRMLFDEIAFTIWGKQQNSTGTPDTLKAQNEDRYSLFEATRNMVQRFATESSLPLTQLEHENFWEYYEPSEKTSVVLYESRGSQDDNDSTPNGSRTNSLSNSPAAEDEHFLREDAVEYSDFDPGPGSLVPAMLMIGAIFACIIQFIFALHSGHVFVASSKNLSAELSIAYLEFVSQITTGFPTAHIESDLRTAATSSLNTLEGWALTDRYDLIMSFLSHADGWAPLTPAPSIDGSFDQSPFDSESISLSSTTPAPSTQSSSSTSATLRHKCHVCGNKDFSNVGNLNRHLRRHQKSRKHSCQNAQLGCKYSDVRKDNVRKHEAKHCQWKGML